MFDVIIELKYSVMEKNIGTENSTVLSHHRNTSMVRTVRKLPSLINTHKTLTYGGHFSCV